MKLQFKCLNSLIVYDKEGYVFEILSLLKKDFKTYYFNQCSNHLNQNSYNLVKEKLDILLEQTNDNIVILFWLGIIDLRKFVDFIVQEEQLKAKLKPIDQKMQKNSNLIKDLERQIQGIIKDIKKLEDQLKGVQRKIDKKSGNDDKKNKNQEMKYKPKVLNEEEKKDDDQFPNLSEEMR